MDWFDLTSFLKPDLLYLFLVHRSLPVPNQVVLDVPSSEGTLEFPHKKKKKGGATREAATLFYLHFH